MSTHIFNTRLHSSRMRTARSLTEISQHALVGGVCSGGHLLQGVSAPEVCSRGVSAPGEMSVLGGVCSQGVSALGGVCSGRCLLWEVSALGGVCSRGGGVCSGGCLLRVVSAQGVYPSIH